MELALINTFDAAKEKSAESWDTRTQQGRNLLQRYLPHLAEQGVIAAYSQALKLEGARSTYQFWKDLKLEALLLEAPLVPFCNGTGIFITKIKPDGYDSMYSCVKVAELNDGNVELQPPFTWEHLELVDAMMTDMAAIGWTHLDAWDEELTVAVGAPDPDYFA